LFGIAGKDVAHWYKLWNKTWETDQQVGFDSSKARKSNKVGPKKNRRDSEYGQELYERTNTVADQHADLVLNRDGRTYTSKEDALFVYQSYLLHRVGYFTPPRPAIQAPTTRSLTDDSSPFPRGARKRRQREFYGGSESDCEEFAQCEERRSRSAFSGEPEPRKKRRLLKKKR